MRAPDRSVPIKIVEEKPVGYLIEHISNKRQEIVSKQALMKRVQIGMYDLINRNFIRQKL